MTENDPIEDIVRSGLHRKAGSVHATPAPLQTIVHRSRRRRHRHRAAGALAGAGVLVLTAGIASRDGDRSTTVAVAGPGTSTTDPVASTEPAAPTTEAAVPTTTRPAPEGGAATVALLPDPGTTGILSAELRTEVSVRTGLADGQEVTIRGWNFPVGASVGFAMCTSDGLGAADLVAGADWCDLATITGLGPSDGAAVVGADGTFTATYQVRRSFGTRTGGRVDCADGNVDPDELDALLANGLLGAGSFTGGAWTCTLVTVATGFAPDGGPWLYRFGTAAAVDFDPSTPLPPVPDPPADAGQGAERVFEMPVQVTPTTRERGT